MSQTSGQSWLHQHWLSRLIYRDAVDEEGDGDISKEEFVKNAMKSKFIFNMLKE